MIKHVWCRWPGEHWWAPCLEHDGTIIDEEGQRWSSTDCEVRELESRELVIVSREDIKAVLRLIPGMPNSALRDRLKDAVNDD